MIWILFILAEVARNYYLIEILKSRPDYLQSFIIRGIVAICYASLIIKVQDWSEAIPVLLFEITTFWILFDLLLNIARGKSWYYRGATSGWLDRLPAWLYWTMKSFSLLYLIYLIAGSIVQILYLLLIWLHG